MSERVKCKCGKPVEWTEWDYFAAPGYRSRENKCECKEPRFQFEAVTKEKRALWETMRDHFGKADR